jgi:hypothetical protein
MPPATQVDAQRRAKVDAARDGWIHALIDKSSRNNLLCFRELKADTLDLTGADARAMERVLEHDEVPLSKLLPPESDLRVAEAKRCEVRAHSMMNLEERGLETLFVARRLSRQAGA